MGYRGRRGRGGGSGRGKQQKGKKKGGWGILENRRNPGSRWVSLGDIIDNIKDRFYCWSRRVPEGAIIRYNKDGKIIGHLGRAPRPWFKK